MNQKLNREVGPRGAVSLGLGSMLGTGVFISLALATEVAGAWVLAAIPVAAAVAWCNARSSARLAAQFPVSGGTYEYGHRLISPLAGFTAGWLFLCAKTASAAAACLGVGLYALHAIGASDAQVATAGLVVLVALTVSVLAGIRRTTWLNSALVMVTLLALAMVISAGMSAALTGVSERVAFGADVGGSAILHAAALVFVAFTGYGRLATLGEEVKNPRKSIPWAINSTVVICAAIYWLVAFAGIAALGAGGFGLHVAPLEAVVRPVGGNTVAAIVALGAITAMLGVGLNLILGLSRVALAMGRRRELPSRLAMVDARGNPVIAVVAVAVAVALVVLIGGIRTAWSFSAVTVLLYYAITNLAAMKLEDGGSRAIPVVGLAGCLGLAVFVDVWSWLAAAVVVVAGLGVRWMMRW